MKAQGLKASLSSFQTIATFIITKKVLDEVQSLSVKLQKRDQDVFEALKMVDQVIKRLTELRSKVDIVFSSWYSQVLQLADDIGVSESIPRKTKLQRNRSNTPSYSPQEHYQRVIAIPLLDSLITQLNERFTGDQNQHILPLLSLIPSIMVNQEQQELLPIHYSLWNDDLPFPRSLGGEIDRWKRLWILIPGESSRNTIDGNTPCNFLEALALCESDSFPNIHQLLLIGCTLPVTSAEAERTFSLLRRIKTYSRSTLAESHFSDLAVIAMHYKERIPVEEVLEAFIQQHPRRLFQKSVLED